MSRLTCWWWLPSCSYRPVQNGRPLDHGDREEQQDEDAERERNGDRSVAPAPELRLGEDDTFWLLLVVHRVPMRPLPDDQRRNGTDQRLDQQRREQSEQIENGESKEFFRGTERGRALAADIDVDGKHEHAGAEDQRGDAVNGVEIAERP